MSAGVFHGSEFGGKRRGHRRTLRGLLAEATVCFWLWPGVPERFSARTNSD
jgi:hypothetical protein